MAVKYCFHQQSQAFLVILILIGTNVIDNNISVLKCIVASSVKPLPGTIQLEDYDTSDSLNKNIVKGTVRSRIALKDAFINAYTILFADFIHVDDPYPRIL